MDNVRKIGDKRVLLAAAALLGPDLQGQEARDAMWIADAANGVPILEGPELSEDQVRDAFAPPVTGNPLLDQWARFRDGFADAMREGFDTIDALERQVFAGEVTFWPGKGSALITKLSEFEGGARACMILWATGDVPELLAMLPGVDAWARLNGCSSVLVEGQLAWKRLLAPAGFKPWSITLEKVL